ncbi:nuclear transport factor 2 family protein [Streptomyces spinosus]|uniref:nuclear transport factor 2 family protein n=1 Tax=Streptomyces spinosus TaxID=2872623 RepID=UPI001CED5756|nr:nuclear transport factor 2 family protein [Streptomyces spinosus]
MNDDEKHTLPVSSAVTAAGVKHALLSYHYQDIGDIDGYASLLDDDVTFEHPGTPARRGADEVLKAQADQATLCSRHELVRVVAENDTVVVLGRLVRSVPDSTAPGPLGVHFADVFTLSARSLLRACRRYYFAAPSGLPGQVVPEDE